MDAGWEGRFVSILSGCRRGKGGDGPVPGFAGRRPAGEAADADRPGRGIILRMARRSSIRPYFAISEPGSGTRGGWAQDLYIFDLKTHDARQIAATKRTERDPMWIGTDVYFVSDRDGVLNLFRYDIPNDKTEQLTRHKTWDVRWASSDNRGKIVYEVDGELYVFDCKSKKETKLAINVPDDGLRSRPARISVSGNIETYDLSPKGRRAVFVARGDIFTVPLEKGPTRNLTASCGAHERHAEWSPERGDDCLYF